MSKHLTAELELDVRISEYRKDGGKQGWEYSRLRSAVDNGVIQGRRVRLNGRVQTMVNKGQAEAYLASVRSMDSAEPVASEAAEYTAADLAKIAAAVADMAMTARQILNAISQQA